MSTIRDHLRHRTDAVPGAHRPRPARAGLAALAVLTLLLVVAFAGWRPWAGSGTIVRAQFAAADQLTPGRTPVRVAGVKVGVVDGVERSPDGRGAVVRMSITDGDVRIARDARADLRLRTVLGGTRYVDLDPGSPSAAPLGGAVIPLARTTAQTDWDDVNQIFVTDVRTGQRRILHALRGGLADPAATARTLAVFGPAFRRIGPGLQALRGTQAGDLSRLVRATARTTAGLGADRARLERLVRAGAHALGVTAAHREALGRAVELTPPALTATRTTMARLDRTLDRLDSLAADLRPGARRLDPALAVLGPALRETDALLRGARPVLRALPPALRDLARLGTQARPLMDALDPTLRRTQDDLVPWLQTPDPDTRLRTYEAIGPLFSVLSSSSGDYDKNGGMFHFPIQPSLDSLQVPCGPGLLPGQLQRCEALDGVLKTIFGPKRRTR